MTPDGTPYKGFKVKIGDIADPSQAQRTYDDIEAILRAHKTPYKIYEEHAPNGTFKSYTIET